MPKRHCMVLNEYIQSKRCGSERNVSIKCDPGCEFYIVAKEIDLQRTNMTAVNEISNQIFDNPMNAMAEIAALTSTMKLKRRHKRTDVEAKKED
jgi:hypothetical protein